MTWSYRVIRQIQKGEITYTIHRCYYDENGKPVMVTNYPSTTIGETLEELELDVANYMMALTKPVLNFEDFEND